MFHVLQWIGFAAGAWYFVYLIRREMSGKKRYRYKRTYSRILDVPMVHRVEDKERIW